MHPQETHHRKQKLPFSKTMKEVQIMHNISLHRNPQFSTLDIIPDGQMDGKRKEGESWLGPLPAPATIHTLSSSRQAFT